VTGPAAVMNFITYRDHKLMRRFNQWQPPRWVKLWALGATRAGDGWLWYLVGVMVLLFGGEPRFQAVATAAVAVGSGAGLFLTVKKATGRRRPHCFETHCWATLLPPDQFSFPSGHTIHGVRGFGIADSVLSRFDRAAPVLCAVSIAISRILLGMHFLSDVLAGAAIGTVVAYVCVGLLGA